jgi:hypothetical protein
MTQTPRIVYRPRFDTTPESELSTLAAVYRFVLSKTEATRPGSPDDAMKGSKSDRARFIIQEPK